MIASEGQRLLVARPEGVSELARLVGVAEQRIDEWRSGRSRPSAASASALRDALGIPSAAWSRAPGATPPAAPPVPPGPHTAPAPTDRRPSSLEEIEEMLALLRGPLGDPSDVVDQKRIETRTKLLGMKARIEHQERLAEDAIVRAHPHWQRIKAALRTALQPFPDALAAVHGALAALGEWDEAVRDLESEELGES